MLKRVEMAFHSETKQLQKINARSRLEELSGINKRSAPIEYKRLSDKYVRRGVEENRKLLVIKNKKLDELNESAHLLKLELAQQGEEVSRVGPTPTPCSSLTRRARFGGPDPRYRYTVSAIPSHSECNSDAGHSFELPTNLACSLG